MFLSLTNPFNSVFSLIDWFNSLFNSLLLWLIVLSNSAFLAIASFVDRFNNSFNSSLPLPWFSVIFSNFRSSSLIAVSSGLVVFASGVCSFFLNFFKTIKAATKLSKLIKTKLIKMLLTIAIAAISFLTLALFLKLTFHTNGRSPVPLVLCRLFVVDSA